MPTLGIAGCSYMSALQDLERSDCLANSHFTELLAKDMNWSYRTLARGGASNFCISYQVQQLIKEDVDFIILGFTTVDRDEITLDLNTKIFDIFDFNYVGYPDLSALDKRFSNKPTIITNSITSLISPLDGEYVDEMEDHIKSYLKPKYSHLLKDYKNYFNNFYSYFTKYIKDLHTITYTILQLEQSGIPYLFFTPFCTNEWLESKKGFIPLDDKAVPWTYPIPEKYGLRYHTTAETQKEIKKHWYPYMSKFFPENFP